MKSPDCNNHRFDQAYSLFVRNILLHFLCLAVFCSGLSAQNTIVEFEKPQLAKMVAGVVTDSAGAVIPQATVEERSEDWKTVIRSTETDDNGRFHLSPSPNKALYHLEFSRSGFNRVRIKLQLEKKATSSVVVKLPVAT